jgi:hypothetical protein
MHMQQAVSGLFVFEYFLAGSLKCKLLKVRPRNRDNTLVELTAGVGANSHSNDKVRIYHRRGSFFIR